MRILSVFNMAILLFSVTLVLFAVKVSPMSPGFRSRFLSVLVLCCIGDVFADVYRWFDEDGSTVFSDTPIDGAEKLEVREPIIVPGQPLPRRTERLAPSVEGPAERRYESMRMTMPTAGETFQNVREVPVSVAVQPALEPGHRIQFLLDGAPHGAPVEGTETLLTDVNRGEHQISAIVLDARGKVLLRAPPIVIYVQQASLLNRPAGS